MFPDEAMTEQAEGVTEQGAQAKAVVVGIQDHLAALLRGLDAGMVDAQAASDLWDAFDQVERLGAARKLLVSQRVEASGVAKSAGFRDTAEYLARRSGCSRRAARRQIQTSEKLTDLPDTAAAVRSGGLSTDQAAAIADAAGADSEAERGLLTMAGRVSLKELQDACLRVKAKADPDPDRTRKRQRRERFLRHGRRPDGTFSLYAQGPPEDEGLLQAALRHGIEDRFRAKTRTGDDGDGGLNRYDQRAYDALYDILRTHIAEGPFAHPLDEESDDSASAQPVDGYSSGGCTSRSNGGSQSTDGNRPSGNPTEPHRAGAPNGINSWDSLLASPGQLRLAGVVQPGPGLVPGGAPTGSGTAPGDARERCGCHRPGTCVGERPPDSRGKRRRRRRQPNPTYTTLVRIDIEALNRGWQEGDEVCDMPGLGPVSVAAVRALLPESIIRLILTRGEEVATVVHAGRGPNTAQKMALNWRQPTCTVEGCNSQIVQADHRIDWATTHRTTLSQLDHLCPQHHGLKTHKGWGLVAGSGKRAFVPPNDPQHPLRKQQPDHSSRQAAA